ncbi:MAG: putative dsRNA-binding protein, partial [Clostridium sp.]|nr:putative dsRNA-binding protein [Clostridium sp.]
YVEGKLLGSGEGYSKKEAEQNAAKEALIKLEVVDE